ncbi:ABC transporter ATP-binding protein [Priestia filamentosa]|uniref:ABC transporter ATP-binding protein n=1 Tax=Priestia filamentosa TaxID=1402861 RepID=UPI001602418C|nr:ABC transporter ATP-binding protein [Priestia filamentosa]
MKEIISIKNVTKEYNGIKVVDNVTFSIYKNEIIGLVGANGAGKSTLISMIVGLKKPNKGEIRIADMKVPNKKVSELIGVMLQEVSMPEKTKVVELLEMVGVFYKRTNNIDFVLKASGLEDVRNSYVDKLSGGKQRRLQFALAIIGDPDILFLDEPTVGLDFQSKKLFWDEINKMVERGTTIILTSHDLKEIEDIANRIIVIDKGRILEDDTITQLRNKYEAHTISIDLPLVEANLDDLKNQSLFSCSLKNNTVIIKTKNMNETINYLLSLDLNYNDLNINQSALENIMSEIISKKEAK